MSRGVIRRRPIEEAGVAQAAAGMGGVAVRSETRSEVRAEVRSEPRAPAVGPVSGSTASAPAAPSVSSTGATVVRRRPAAEPTVAPAVEAKKLVEAEVEPEAPQAARSVELEPQEAPVESQKGAISPAGSIRGRSE